MTTNLDVRDIKQYCYNAEWTTQTPTKPGWYWGRNVSGLCLIRVTQDKEYLYFENVSDSRYKITHWLGPLPEPRFEE